MCAHQRYNRGTFRSHYVAAEQTSTDLRSAYVHEQINLFRIFVIVVCAKRGCNRVPGKLAYALTYLLEKADFLFASERAPIMHSS